MPSYIGSGALTFILVPDNTMLDAYLTAAENCIYIIHVASPLPTQLGNLVSQAVAGNMTILSAAEQTPSVKRVVFTGSTSSFRPFDRSLLRHPSNQAIAAGGDAESEAETFTAETKVPTQPPIPDSAPGFHRYNNSKLASTNLVHAYGASTSGNRHFSIINLFPGWILGPEGLARTKAEALKGSNLVLGFLFYPLRLNPYFGLEHEEENAPLLAESVHIDDVVEGHVKALDTEKVPGEYHNFLLNSDSPTGPVWVDAEGIVRRELREEVEEGLIPFAGTLGASYPFAAMSSKPFRLERLACCQTA